MRVLLGPPRVEGVGAVPELLTRRGEEVRHQRVARCARQVQVEEREVRALDAGQRVDRRLAGHLLDVVVEARVLDDVLAALQGGAERASGPPRRGVLSASQPRLQQQQQRQ